MDFYKKIDNLIQCGLCENHCRLKDNQTGICGVIKNDNGNYKSLVYGYPAAIHIDPIEKKPLRNFMPGSKAFSVGTYGCNMSCDWCQNFEISQFHPTNQKKSDYFSPDDLVKTALAGKCESIAYTYNEPTVFYQYAKDIGLIAKQKGLKNIFVSNGYQTKEVIEDMAFWVDACNIDLKAFSQETYQQFIGANFEIILRNLELIVKEGMHLEISTLIIPGLNDSEEELTMIANFIVQKLGVNTPWHVAAFHPDYQMLKCQRTPRETIIFARDIGLKAGLKFVYTGNI